MIQPTCVLRTQHLCDGHRVVDYRRAPRGRVCCYCRDLELAAGDDWSALACELRTDRARTVARSAELQRLTERSSRLTGAPTGAPPY